MRSDKKPTILLVDDDEVSLYLYENILKPLNVDLILAKSGKQALAGIENKDIALALLDIQMPEMDGVTLAGLIQNDQSRDIIPIIFITAEFRKESELEECYDAGAVDFIMKPIRPKILLGKVRIFLELFYQKQIIQEDRQKIEKSAKELYKLNETLRESNDLTNTLLNASPEGIIILNPDYIITNVSNVIPGIFSYQNRIEFTGRSFFDFFDLKDKPRALEVLKKTKTEKIIQNIEFNLIRKDNSNFITEVSITLILDSSNSVPIAYMAVIRDISERKKIEQQLIRTERMVSLGEMSSGMAHEINQPLISITLSIENLLNKIKQENQVDDKYLQKKSEKIFDDISRISRIIDHVRAFSRDHDQYIFTTFNINDSVRNAVSLINEQFKHHAINLVVLLENKPMQIIGNTYRFEQVVLNLLSNAKDALNEKAKISGEKTEGTIIIRSYFDILNNYLEINDNGIGISPEIIDRIMDPFFTTKNSGEGTGLGLSISFGIIREMSGSIDVESRPFIGSTFRITVPAVVK
jgi:PAS domain S-box-containing protein